MAKNKWYIKPVGKPYYKNMRLVQDYKIHWVFILWIRIKQIFIKPNGKY